MIKIRFYMDKDREQDWLNKMANDGWAFKSFCLFIYRFEKCEPGEYVYQIDLLDSFCQREEAFMNFMQEMKVEVVDRWFRWVILRKKSIDGAFEMYTDTESKIASYRKIKKMFTGVTIIEGACLAYEIFGSLVIHSPLLIGAAVVIGLVFIGCLRVVWRCQWKIDELGRQ